MLLTKIASEFKVLACFCFVSEKNISWSFLFENCVSKLFWFKNIAIHSKNILNTISSEILFNAITQIGKKNYFVYKT